MNRVYLKTNPNHHNPDFLGVASFCRLARRVVASFFWGVSLDGWDLVACEHGSFRIASDLSYACRHESTGFQLKRTDHRCEPYGEIGPPMRGDFKS